MVVYFIKTDKYLHCSKCQKVLIPGLKVGMHLGKLYCYHCGHDIELGAV